MNHSFSRNSVSLKDFTPPRGTMKTVELTLIERKNIGRRGLADHVARLFSHDPIRVTIKKHGRHITIANIGWGFQITRRAYRFGRAVENGFKTLEEFTDHLARTFVSTELLRMAKLIRKQANDKRSVEKSKKSDLRIVSFDW